MPEIIMDIKLDFKDVLLQPKWSTVKSRSDVNLYREITFRHSKKTYNGIPIMASNMENIGTFEVAKKMSQHGLFTAISKYYTLEEWKKFAIQNPECLKNVAATLGLANGDFDRLKSILAAIPEISFILFDVAHGNKDIIDNLMIVRDQYPNHTIIAGNVADPDLVERLIRSGADIVKIGIGSGSVCTTRVKAGIGYPQFSLVLECSAVAHALNAHIISDGGCVCAGDIAKAFGAGADFVMIGGLLAGHTECGGGLIEKDGKKFMQFYGMSSDTSMIKHAGEVAEYRSSEGKTVEIPFRGAINDAILDILGGLRSTCTYTGVAKLSELPHVAKFLRCTQQFNTIFDNLSGSLSTSYKK